MENHTVSSDCFDFGLEIINRKVKIMNKLVGKVKYEIHVKRNRFDCNFFDFWKNMLNTLNMEFDDLIGVILEIRNLNQKKL